MMEEEKKTVTVLPTRAARGVRRPIVRAAAVATVSPDWAGLKARPWAATGSIEVEALAVWAYRDQRVDRHATSGMYAAEAAAAGYEPRGSSNDGCAAIADIAHMGARIDRGGALVRDLVHPAADAVAVALAGIDGGELVAFHARLGGRPGGWAEPERWYRPVVWVKPGVEAQWERTGRGTSPTFCRVIPTVTREELVRRRAGYGRWWEALDLLAWKLSFRAMGFTVAGPRAPREPWAGQVEGAAGRSESDCPGHQG